MRKSLFSIILCITLCLSFSVFSSAEQEIDLSAFETVGETVLFGHYEQDDNLNNGKEPIEWIVLDVQNGKSLLLSKYAISRLPYDSSTNPVTWEHCFLREWLNASFLALAFSTSEQESIALTHVDNGTSQHNTFLYSNDDNDTDDYIFLLSYSEYKFYLDSVLKSYSNISLYQNDPGVTSWSHKWAWWLRSPNLRGNTQTVARGGTSQFDTWARSFYEELGVRPVMWVDLNALQVQLESDESSDKITTLSDSYIWGQEYTQDDLTYSFVQEGALSYYSLRGKDSDTLVNAVTTNAIPGTERINQKIQDIMQACNYESTEGEIDGVRTELYGSQESDAFVMATYGDWGVNMMLFVDGATGIADYFSGTITTEEEVQPSSKGSLFGSAMQEASHNTSATNQFNLTAKEYIDAFNKQYGNMGMTLVADSSRDDCLLAIRGEPTDIRIQFCDKVNGPWTTGSGLDMKEWNWLYAYIATDDYSIDVEYFASFPMMCSFFAAIVGCDYTQEEFMDNCNASGPNGYPILTYTKNGIKNEIQFRDASVGNYHQTVYSASVELVQ